MRDVGEGDRVRKGEVLARLRDAEYQDKVRQATWQAAAAEAAAEKARLDFERAPRLFATQSITRPSWRPPRPARRHPGAAAAAQALSRARREVGLRDTLLTAPVDGDVMKKSVEPGAFAGPGLPAFVVGETAASRSCSACPIPPFTGSSWDSVTWRQHVRPTGQDFEAKISRIARHADSVTRNFDVEVAIPNPDHF